MNHNSRTNGKPIVHGHFIAFFSTCKAIVHDAPCSFIPTPTQQTGQIPKSSLGARVAPPCPNRHRATTRNHTSFLPSYHVVLRPLSSPTKMEGQVLVDGTRAQEDWEGEKREKKQKTCNIVAIGGLYHPHGVETPLSELVSRERRRNDERMRSCAPALASQSERIRSSLLFSMSLPCCVLLFF
jgi:hypothetical protein